MSDHLALYLEGVITDWYTHAARWKPTPDGLDGPCITCYASTFVDVLRLEEWPHSVTHPLVSSLEVALSETERFLNDVGTPDQKSWAKELVKEIVAGHSASIDDVLVQCVGPYFDNYLSLHAARGVADFERLLAQQAS